MMKARLRGTVARQKVSIRCFYRWSGYRTLEGFRVTAVIIMPEGGFISPRMIPTSTMQSADA